MLLRMNGARAPLSPIIDSGDPLSSGYGTGNNIPGLPVPSNSGPFVNSLPGREFMGTMETILQSAVRSSDPDYRPVSDRDSATFDSVETDDPPTVSSSSSTTDSQLLNPQALLDHMEFLIKVRRLQITVGSAKWSFKDLCQRATLPFGSEMHPIQAYLDMIIPCLIITPLDCFWEGAKVLGPEEATWVPWLGERTLIQWPHLDPVGLLQELRAHYGNHSHHVVDSLIAQFRAAGINHGYLNRTCLDPTDPACPVSAPNYRGKPPNVVEVLSGGCPGFAANVLHWPEEIIVGGRQHADTSTENRNHNSDQFVPPVLVRASALQSLILLRSPRDLYEAVRHSDPYKHEGWTLADAQHVLDEWRRNLRRLVMEHNVGMQPDSTWHFYAFTDNSLRDLLRELTLRLGPIKVVGSVLLVFLYGLVCLLGWRDPVRSQCWLALAGLLVAALSAVAGLGICAVFGLPFNVLTIQVLPFLLMGLGVDGVFTLTTCHDCCVARRATCSPSNTNASKSSSLTRWASNSSIATCSSGSTRTSSTYYSSLSSSNPYTAPVLAQHGPSLLYGTVAVAAAFFSAAYIPIPLMRQFCLQAGILVIVQSVAVFILFPVLLQFDGIRRSQRRLDILCCLRHPSAIDTTTTSLLHPGNHPFYTAAAPTAHSARPRRHAERRSTRNPAATVSPPPQMCAAEAGAAHVHSQRGANIIGTPVSVTAPSPSIQVSVVNHLTPLTGGHVTDITCSSVGGLDHACGLGSSHTVRATVTVQGLSESPQTATTTTTSSTNTHLITTKLGGDSDVPGSIRLKKCSPAPMHVRAETSDLDTGSQTSVHNRASSSCPPATAHTVVNRISPAKHPSRPSSPLLVRFSRRLALLLTYHWSVQAVIFVLGSSLLIVAGCIWRYCLHLGLDWATLTPMDTVEYGFVKASEKAFGLYNFQLVARGTDLPGSRAAPIPSVPIPPTSSSSARFGQIAPASANHRLLHLGTGSSGRLDSSASMSSPPGGLIRSGTNMATVGRGIDFPIQQRRLHHLYARLLKLPGVMLAGRQVWLAMMRDWLQHVQDAFDADRALGQITDQGEWTANATELGVLGLRLIVQTDRGPELGRIKTGRLVHGGIVDPPAFYVLLRVWRTYDALNFSSLACVIHPEPTPLPLGHVAVLGPGRPSDLYALPPAEPIEFVQTNFYAHGIRGTGVQLQLVQNVRHLTESATMQGVPAFPIGVPFTFAEHYLYLLNETGIAFGIYISVLLVTGLVLFSSPIVVLLLVSVGAGGGVSAAICGLYLLGLELNPISTGLLLFSGGLGARLAAGFLGAWPDLHNWNRVGRSPPGNAKFCLCRRPDCTSVLSTQYCAVLGVSQMASFPTPEPSVVKDQPQISADHSVNSCGSSKTSEGSSSRDRQPIHGPLPPESSSFTPTGRLDLGRGRMEQRRQCARSELVCLMRNQLSPALHTTVGLILALALLAAARVQFIANYFFYLIAFVSVICLLNTIFLIPIVYYWLHPFKEAAFYGDYYLPNPTLTRTSVEPRPRKIISGSYEPRSVLSVGFTRTKTEPSVIPNPVVFPSSVSASSLSSSGGSASSSSSSSSSHSCHSPNPNNQSSSSSALLPGIVSDAQQASLYTQSHSDAVTDRNAYDKSRASFAQSTSELCELYGVRLRDVTQSLHHNLDWLDRATAAALVAATAAAVASASSSTSSPRHSRPQPPSRPASLSTISEEPSHSSSTVSLNRISLSNGADANSNSNPSNQTAGSSPITTTVAPDIEDTTDRLSATRPSNSFDVGQLLTQDFAPKMDVLHEKRNVEDNLPAIPTGLSNPCLTYSARNLFSRLSYKTEISPPPSYSSVVNLHPADVSAHADIIPAETRHEMSSQYATKTPSLSSYPCSNPPVRSTPYEYRESPEPVDDDRPSRRKSSRFHSSHPVYPTTLRTSPQVRLELHHHHHHHHYASTSTGDTGRDEENDPHHHHHHHHHHQRQHSSTGSQTPRTAP
ncbi:Protein patched 1 [Fasciola gigantica]|uniref:Protein patched 1 n=1 Tax=Fasciola gigantica TaxID=46835 RepID=A0A504Z3R7_FASGI|nr:Protein patched 1 [Fasciola gigantica]